MVIGRWLATLHLSFLGIRSVSPITNHSRSTSLSSLMIYWKAPTISLCRTVIFFHQKFLILIRPAPLQFLLFPIARFTSMTFSHFDIPEPTTEIGVRDYLTSTLSGISSSLTVVAKLFPDFFYPGCIQIILSFDFPKTPPERRNFICIHEMLLALFLFDLQLSLNSFSPCDRSGFSSFFFFLRQLVRCLSTDP